MMETLIFTVILVVSVLILVFILKSVTENILSKNEKSPCVVTIIPVNGNIKDVEYTVRSLLWGKNWRKYTGQFILIVIIECDKETIELCRKLCAEFVPVSCCNIKELEAYIQNPSLMLKCT